MSKKNRAYDRNRWTFKEAVLSFIPGNSTFGTMRARQARHGVAFADPRPGL